MLINSKTDRLEETHSDQNRDLSSAATSEDKQTAPLPSTHAQAHKIKERRCIVTKENFHQDELLRFVLSPDNVITPDLDTALPGRGVWVSCSKDALQKAISNNLFSKSLKQKCTIPNDLVERVENILQQKCLKLISLSRRSGDCIIGFDKAYSQAQKSDIALYITASEANSSARRKLENAMGKDTQVIDKWDSDTLSVQFGTENTNHVVVKPSGIANKFIKDYRKLCAFSVQYDQKKRKAVKQL